MCRKEEEVIALAQPWQQAGDLPRNLPHRQPTITRVSRAQGWPWFGAHQQLEEGLAVRIPDHNYDIFTEP